MKVLHMISGGDSGGAKTHLFTLLDELKKYLVPLKKRLDALPYSSRQIQDARMHF